MKVQGVFTVKLLFLVLSLMSIVVVSYKDENEPLNNNKSHSFALNESFRESIWMQKLNEYNNVSYETGVVVRKLNENNEGNDQATIDNEQSDNPANPLNLNKNEVIDSQQNKNIGYKLCLILVLIIIIILVFMFINRKITNYIEQENTIMITQPRRGRLELYRGQKFKKMHNESESRLDTLDFKIDNSIHQTTMTTKNGRPHTDRELILYEEEKPSDGGLMIEEEKSISIFKKL